MASEQLLSNVSEFVRSELNTRRKYIQSKNETSFEYDYETGRNLPKTSAGDELLWNVGKTPWIKAQSNAIKLPTTENPSSDAPILYGGMTKSPNADGIFEPRVKFSDQYESNQLRPRPGITRLSCNWKGSFGTTRELKFTVLCHTNDDFEQIMNYYMSPGIGVLVEWGWSGPADNFSIPLYNRPYDDNDRFLVKAIQKNVEKSNGNYDGMYGLVTDFNITLQDDGSFECEVTLIAPGIALFDLPLNIPTTRLGEDFTKYTDAIIAGKVDSSPIGTNIAETLGDLAYAREKDVRRFPIAERDSAGKEIKTQSGTHWYDKLISVFSSDDDKNKKPLTEEEKKVQELTSGLDIYVTWRWVESVISDWFSFKLPRPVIDSSVGGGLIPAYNPSKFSSITAGAERAIMAYNEEQGKKFNKTVKTTDLWRSYNPLDVIIPKHPTKGFTKSWGSAEISNVNTFDTKTPGVGNLSNVYINYNTVFKDAFLNAETLSEAITRMLNRLNDASGGIWDLKLLFNKDSFTNVRVVDMNCSYGVIADGSTLIPITFSPYTTDAIERDMSINLTIPSSLKTTVAISANSNTSPVVDKSKDGAVRSFANGWADKFTHQSMIYSKKTQSEQERVKSKNDQIDRDKQNMERQQEKDLALRSALSKLYWEPLTSEERNVCIELLTWQRDNLPEKTTDGSPTKTTIDNIVFPLEVTLTIDGISGFRWGNAFTVTSLPPRFKNKNIMFQLVGLEHSVDDTGWTTSCRGIMRIMPSTLGT